MITLSILLIVNGAFNALVWPQFYRRVLKDPRARDAAGKPTAFLTVHMVLFIVALVLAAASVLAGIAGLTGFM